jgi:hypothetical protein
MPYLVSLAHFNFGKECNIHYTLHYQSRPTKRAADRPVAAIFHSSTIPNGVSAQTSLLGGRRLTHAVGLAAFCGCGSSSPPQRLPPAAIRVHCCAADQTASVIFCRRLTVALQPPIACPSRTSRMLRRCAPSRFARGFTARHG